MRNDIPKPYNPVQIHRLLVSPPDKPFKLAKVLSGEISEDQAIEDCIKQIKNLRANYAKSKSTD